MLNGNSSFGNSVQGASNSQTVTGVPAPAGLKWGEPQPLAWGRVVW